MFVIGNGLTVFVTMDARDDIVICRSLMAFVAAKITMWSGANIKRVVKHRALP